MEKLHLNPNRCKGCGYCIRACKQGALYLSEHVNLKGYSTAAVHEEKCIRCGACYRVCPDYVFEIK